MVHISYMVCSSFHNSSHVCLFMCLFRLPRGQWQLEMLMKSCWGHDMFVQVDLRKVAVGDADEELLGT